MSILGKLLGVLEAVADSQGQAVTSRPTETVPSGPVPESGLLAGNTITTKEAFSQDCKRLDEWTNLAKDEQKKALLVHLISLDAKGYERFMENMRLIKPCVMADIKDHEDNERFAWGNYIEDQWAYLAAKEKTGERDPKFMRRLNELQGQLYFVEWITKTAAESWELILERRAAQANVEN
jgi:hypothetical protein